VRGATKSRLAQKEGELEVKLIVKKIQVLSALVLLMGLIACHPYEKQVPTGSPISIQNVYANPSYDHGRILNVLVLPIDNPLNNTEVFRHQHDLAEGILRNFGKFHYFNLQYQEEAPIGLKQAVDLNTGRIDRLKIGTLGKEYNSQAVLQICITEYRPFAPMRMNVKAVLIDTNTGEKIWAADQVFDADDAVIVNGMRYWWNERKAGGDDQNRFSASSLYPTFFNDFIFYSLAESYQLARISNALALQKQQEFEEKQKVEQEKKAAAERAK
jgi:hypothetical protein